MRYYKRSFLNRKKGLASIEGTITVDNAQYDVPYIQADLSINDCNRTVHLSFDGGVNKADSMKEKLQVLVESVLDFQKQYLEAVDMCNKQLSERKENEE
jgi:hypothetical protein